MGIKLKEVIILITLKIAYGKVLGVGEGASFQEMKPTYQNGGCIDDAIPLPVFFAWSRDMCVPLITASASSIAFPLCGLREWVPRTWQATLATRILCVLFYVRWVCISDYVTF